MFPVVVNLPAEVKATLSAMARKRRMSEDELIREAVTEKVAGFPRPRPTVPLFEHGPADPTAAERVDELLEGRVSDWIAKNKQRP